jgi:hypothetical protein
VAIDAARHADSRAADVDEQAVTITEPTQTQPRGAPGAPGIEAFLGDLLKWQCQLVGAAAGVVYLRRTREREGGIASTWTDRAATLLTRDNLARFQRIGVRTVEGDQAIVEEFDAGGGLYTGAATHQIISTPLRSAEMTHGAVIVVVERSTDMLAPAEAVTRLTLSAERFEAFMWRQQCLAEAKAKVQLRETLELLDAAQQGANAETMGQLFCHELERRFGCTRASIGLVRGQAIKLVSVGNTDDLHKHSAVAESLEGVMEECADQDVEILYPQPTGPDGQVDDAERRVMYAHGQHSERFGPCAIASLPLRVANDLVGVVVLEREKADPFPPGALPLLRLVAEYIGPAMWTRRLADRKVLAVSRDRFIELGEKAVGPRHTTLKLVLLSILLVFLATIVVPVPDRVVATGALKAMTMRRVPAPFAAQLESVSVLPGDIVNEGDVLGQLDTLELTRQIAETEHNLSARQDEERKARAEGDVAAANIAYETALGLEARLELLQDRLARSTLRAPIAGVVTQGDLQEFINSPVDPSQVLFEIIDPSDLRLIIEVDERDIHRIEVGDVGRFTPAGSPGRRLPIEVDRIVPAAAPVAGNNVYRVEAVLTNPEDARFIQAGMNGTIRLRDGYSNTFGILTRRLVDSIRMKLWW